ncbi:MAG: hypothetical protein C0485_02790 [Pirellula sp.]|nr:hypothetical protein [Pirellula sp.]
MIEKGMSVSTLYRGCAARRKRRQGEEVANLVTRTLLELDLIALRFFTRFCTESVVECYGAA